MKFKHHRALMGQYVLHHTLHVRKNNMKHINDEKPADLMLTKIHPDKFYLAEKKN